MKFSELIALGYDPVPLHKNDKRPLGEGWTTRDYSNTPDSVKDIGIRLGAVRVLDIDVYDAKLADKMERIARKTLGKTTPSRIGQPPKRALLFRMEKPGPKRLHAFEGSKDRIEVLGLGQQCKVVGIHPVTRKPYVWSRPIPPVAKLPLLTEDQLDAMLNAMCGEKVRPSTTTKTNASVKGRFTSPRWSDKEIDQYVLPRLLAIDPGLPEADWWQVRAALHAGFHGDDEGLSLFQAWSSGDLTGVPAPENFVSNTDCASKWRATNTKDIGTGTLDFVAKRYGFKDAAHVVSTNEFIGEGSFFSTSLEIANDQTEGNEHPEFIENFIQVGATILHGSAKSGKSWLMLEAGEAIANGIPFMGRAVRRAKVLIVGAEDSTTRFKRRLEIMGVKNHKNLMLMNRKQLKSWGIANRPEEGWTPASLVLILREHTGADVIVLDTIEVIEARLEIEHGDKGSSVTRRDYLSTSDYDEIAEKLGIAVVLVAHWGMVKSLPMAVMNPHEMINSTKAKLNGVITSITLGPLPNQDLNDGTRDMQLSLMGRDLTTGKQFLKISRDESSWRTTLHGEVRDVVLRDSLSEVIQALHALKATKDAPATQTAVGDLLGISRTAVKKKIAAIRKNAQGQGGEPVVGGYRLRTDGNGTWLENVYVKK